MGAESWIWIVAWALVLLLVVWLLVREPRHEGEHDPDAILRERFARGEITEEEYRRATAALAADPSSPIPGARHPRHRHEVRHDRP
jgi:uncharacterized membrane protein